MDENSVTTLLSGQEHTFRLRLSLVASLLLPLSVSLAGTPLETFSTQSGAAYPQEATGVGTQLGQLAPDFTLADPEGRTLTLSALRGREVLLVFWSTICPHCAARIPLLNKVNQEGPKVVAVALGATAAQVSQYVGYWKVTFDLLPDTEGSVGRTYGVSSVPQPFWLDADGTILLSGPEYGSLIWDRLSQHELRASASAAQKVYVVPYVGDIDGGIGEGWFAFYDRLRRWHDDNAMPGSFSFFPTTMNDRQFNQIIADMHMSPNVELILKGEDTYQGRRLDLMSRVEVKLALQAWQQKFVSELQRLGYADIALPVAYNQLLQRFNETIRDAAHDVGFQIFLDQGASDEYGFIDMLPDFDITQYCVSLIEEDLPDANSVFKSVSDVIQEIFDYDDEHLLYINGIKVIPLLCHQEDFRVSENSDQINEEKWGIYTELLLAAREDPRIVLLRPREVYQLRHNGPRNSVLTDFETPDHGWTAEGAGQGRFEIGPPTSPYPNRGECWTDCFGTGPAEDHSPFGVNAACTNLDGYMAPFESVNTNSLTSPVYDFRGRRDVALELWAFMEIEGLGYDQCIFQYKNDPGGEWTTFETFGTDAEDSDGWTLYEKDLSHVADGRSYFQLRFYCTTDGSFEGSGLCVDDIRLTWSKVADLNGDNEVNLLDYAQLAAAWLDWPGDPVGQRYDLSGDGVVDWGDLAEFAGDWLSQGYSRQPVVRGAVDRSIQICDWQGCAAGAASVSIDDSFTSCRDILTANGFRGTYYLAWTDTFTQAEWDIWKEMYAEGHELGGHSTTHFSGDFLEEANLRWELSSNRKDIVDHVGMPEEELTSFAWPRGDTTAAARAIASEYYVSARGYHINKLEEKNPADFMNLKSLNTPHYHDPEYDPPDYFQKADEAEAQGKWVNFVFHNECLDDGAISYLATKDLWVAPVGRVAKYIKERQNARILDIVQNPAEIGCMLVSALDPRVFNQKLTIRIATDPARVQTVLVNDKSAAYVKGADHVLINVRPSGSDQIRLILGATGR